MPDQTMDDQKPMDGQPMQKYQDGGKRRKRVKSKRGKRSSKRSSKKRSRK